MTAKELLDLIDALDFASNSMLFWLHRRDYRPWVLDDHDRYAVSYARTAGRLANTLIDLAELGERMAAA